MQLFQCLQSLRHRFLVAFVVLSTLLFSSLNSALDGVPSNRDVARAQEVVALAAAHSPSHENDLAASTTPALPPPPPASLSNINLNARPHFPEKFTMIVQTYQRDESLSRVLRHFCQMDARLLACVVVVWNNINRLPPTSLLEMNCSAPISFSMQTANSINNRFSPSLLERCPCTTDAIFSLDDDLILDLEGVQSAFALWRAHRSQLVGFVARRLSSQASSLDSRDMQWKYSPLGIRLDNLQHNSEAWYNLVLTGAAFLHSKYLLAYSLLPEVSQYVDQVFNCEDIAMNFLVANATRLPPMYVASYFLKSSGDGLFKRNGHFDARGKCGEKFSQIFSGNPLVSSHKFYRPLRLSDRQWKKRMKALAGLLNIRENLHNGL